MEIYISLGNRRRFALLQTEKTKENNVCLKTYGIKRSINCNILQYIDNIFHFRDYIFKNECIIISMYNF